MARASKASGKGAAVDLSGVPADVLAGARLVLADGLSAVKAAEQAGCSRHAIARLLAKPGAAAALMAAAAVRAKRGRSLKVARRAEVVEHSACRES